MHRSPSRVVSTRPRPSGRRAMPLPCAAPAVIRRPMEMLESRLMFAVGDFDASFGGGDGAAVVDLNGPVDWGSTLAVLPGGKVIVGGSVGNGTNTNDVFGLTRLNADGSVDTTFGTAGKATLSFGQDVDLNAVAITPDGKIVAVGQVVAPLGVWDWAVARFNADGTPDTTFDGDGKLTADFFSFGDTAYGVDVQPDGKIVVTGVATGVTSQMAVVRYNTDGTLDATFDGDGKQFVDFFGGVDFSSNVKVQADNKIVLVGGSVQPGSYRRMVLVRLNPDGTFDNTFDADGQASADFGSSAMGRDVEIQSDGKYVVGGWVDTNPTGDDKLDMAVARFNANGSLDASFGTGGRTVFTGTGGFTFSNYGVEIQNNGKVVVAGTIKDPNYDANLRTYGGVARVNANGAPDTTFGPGGLRQISVPGTDVGESNITDLELAADGGILLAGYGSVGNNVDFAAVKLVNDDGPPPVPGSISGVVFNDANQNGVRDAGEAVLPGWTVFQDTNNNGVLDSGPKAIASTDVPKEISTVGTPTIESTLVVTGAGSISDINVTVNINHTWDEDLVVTLVSPSGQSVVLIRNEGVAGDNFTNTVLDDEATTPIKDGTAPFTGSFKPEQPLSALDDLDANGTWTLRVQDEVDGDGGQLNGWSITLEGAGEASVVSGADGSYSFTNLNPGTYTIREVVQNGWTQTAPPSGAQVVDLASGQAVTGRDFGNFNGVLASAVVGRRVFYNNSAFDGNSAAANPQDDAAIATDKAPLLPLQSSAASNITSYNKGINGVMIDMTRMTSNLEADDFEFRVGNTNSPALWTLAPAPLSITERPSGLPDGSTRVTIVWADNAIKNQWLEVVVKANGDSRLTNPDVFYFGNLVGETVSTAGAPTRYVVDGSDLLATRAANQRGPVPVTSAADHNRDGRVNVLDEMLVRGNYRRTLAEIIRPRSGADFSDTAIVSATGTRRTRLAPVTRSVLA